MKHLLRLQDLELSQAQLRLVVALAVSIYAAVAHHLTAIDSERLTSILLFSLVFTGISVALLAHMLLVPGVSFVRRLFAILLDNAGATLVMIMGGETLLPVFCVLLSMTVGNGVRFGRSYLILATAIGLVSLACVGWFMPFLQEHPTVWMLMVFSLLVVPTFSYFLLGRLQHAVETAHAASQAKSRFLAQASHDLRQPIHAIGLFTACLRDTALHAEQRHLVDSVDRSLLGIEQLFRSLLDLYTLDQSQVQPSWKAIDLAHLLTDLVRQNGEAARWAGVELRLHACTRHIHSDPVLLSTLLQNLIGNAIKYAPGRPLLIGSRRQGNSLTLQIHDRGPGIAAEHLPHLFDEFYRVREARDRDIEGVGLGLSIVRRIAHLLELEVSIASCPGRGTSISIAGLKTVAAPVCQAIVQHEEIISPLSGRRVLLIDDDHNVLHAMAGLLRKWGCEVQTATGIPEQDTACDIVLTDFDLGRNISGADCVAYVKALHGREIPAVVLTGHERDSVRRSLGDEDIPILTKPVRAAELRSLLVSLLLQPKTA